jgi:hypothetical protein
VVCSTPRFQMACEWQWLQGRLCATLSSSQFGLHREFKAIQWECYFKDYLGLTVSSRLGWTSELKGLCCKKILSLAWAS